MNENNCAVIEFGSNTVNLAVFHIEGEKLTEVYKEKEFLGVITCLRDGALSEEGLAKAVGVLKKLKFLAQSRAGRIDLFATASLRHMKNAQEVEDAVKKEVGLPLTVVSPEREAYYDYLAATHALPMQNMLAVDIGGGSIEIVHIRERELAHSATLPTGSLKLYMEHVQGRIPSREEIGRIEEQVREHVAAHPWLANVDCETACTIGGTGRAVAKLHKALRGSAQKEPYEYDAADLNGMVEFVNAPGGGYAAFIASAAPERANTLAPGMTALRVIAQTAGAKKIVLCKYGVREGYVIEHIIRGVTV